MSKYNGELVIHQVDIAAVQHDLRRGDRIISVNGIKLRGRHIKETVNILRTASAPVELEVQRIDVSLKTDEECEDMALSTDLGTEDDDAAMIELIDITRLKHSIPVRTDFSIPQNDKGDLPKPVILVEGKLASEDEISARAAKELRKRVLGWIRTNQTCKAFSQNKTTGHCSSITSLDLNCEDLSLDEKSSTATIKNKMDSSSGGGATRTFDSNTEEDNDDDGENSDEDYDDDDDDDLSEKDQELAWKEGRVSKYLLNKYSELSGEILAIELSTCQIAVDFAHSKAIQLGLRLAGNRDLNQMSVFICGIRPGSIADRDGRLEVGDQLLELNGQSLYGLSHLNAAPVIRSIYLEVIGTNNKIFRRSRTNTLRFVVQRNPENMNHMAASVDNHLDVSSTKTSRKSSVETTLSILSSPQKRTSKAKQSLELMNLAFGGPQGTLCEQMHSITLYRGSSGYGFAIMEGSPTNEEGIYIKQVINGGSAAKEGTLCPGDRIVRVNKRDVMNASYDTVLDMIRSEKHELRLQVSRWVFSSVLAASEKKETKRYSAPHLLQSIATAIRGQDITSRRPSSSTANERSTNSAVTNLDTPSETNHNLLYPDRLLSRLRRASSPNIGVPGFRNLSPPACVPKGTPRHSLLPVPDSSVSDKPDSSDIIEDPNDHPTVRQIKPGIETQIRFKPAGSCGLGIGFIGGCETALNVLVVHELYPNGAAAIDARLRPGDHILKVNFTLLTGLPFLEGIKQVHKAYMSTLQAVENVPTTEGKSETDVGTPATAAEPSLTQTLQPTSQSTDSETFSMVVFRPERQDNKWYDQEVTVELIKKAGKGLGICIADRCVHFKTILEGNGGIVQTDSSNSPPVESISKKSYGVIITEIVKGSLAASDGRLLTNDQILVVNGEDTSCLTSEIVGALLKAAQNKVTIKVGRLKNQIVLPSSASHLFNNPQNLTR